MQTSTVHPNEPFVDEKAAARHLGISTRTLQRWRTEPPEGGAPRFFKIGAKRVAYRISELNQWAEGRAFSTTTEIDVAGTQSCSRN